MSWRFSTKNLAHCFLDWLNLPNAFEAAHNAAKLCRGGFDSLHGKFLAMVTVLNRFAARKSVYDFQRNVVFENRVERPIYDWERPAAKAARENLERIERLHLARRGMARRGKMALNAENPLPITPSA